VIQAIEQREQINHKINRIMLGNYNTVADAKRTLIAYGFEISANVYGEIEYLNAHNVKVTIRKYKDGTCKLW
jgi:hypothetical protein